MDLAPDGLPVLEGQTGEASEPMGVSLYKRPADGVTFAIVAPKTGGTTDYLWQYRLERKSPGERITATLVRRFGNFSRRGAEPGEIGEIEAVVVDDELGYVYYSDERFGIRKWHADPDHADAARELAVFGTEGYAGDREGLAIYAPGVRLTPTAAGPPAFSSPAIRSKAPRACSSTRAKARSATRTITRRSPFVRPVPTKPTASTSPPAPSPAIRAACWS